MHIVCPICDDRCFALDVVDFSKSCEEVRGKYLPLTGIPIYYYRCEHCGFCFAPEFSHWTLEDFENRIYNMEYGEVDPDYLDVRPRANAKFLLDIFSSDGTVIRHLDYGGGNGLLSSLLRESGWRSTSYDPFVDRDISPKDLGKFDLITAFEVFEHVPDVTQLITTLSSLLAQDGVVLFSTLLTDGNLASHQRLNWWYASPRNGHISLFSSKSLALLGAKESFRFRSLATTFHAFWKTVPPWIERLIPSRISLQHHKEGQEMLAVESDSAEECKNHGNTLLSLGRLDEAEQAYRRALELKPDFAAAHNNLGNVLRLGGRLVEAEQSFRAALALLPESAEVHNNFGNVLMDAGRTEEAEQFYRKAAVLAPDYAMAYANRGHALRALGRLEVAEKSYQKAIGLKPDSAEAYYGLGNVRLRGGFPYEAEQAYRQAIALKPDYAEAYAELGEALHSSGRAEEAEQACRQALELKHDQDEAYIGLGNALMDLLRLDEAEQAYSASVHPAARYFLSLLYLLQGRLEEGFALHEERFGHKCLRNYNQMAHFVQMQGGVCWEGEPLEGGSLLVITEQGAGDNLMMMRYLPLLKQRGVGNFTVCCDPVLERMFQAMTAVDEVDVITEQITHRSFAYYCPLMSLPHLFGTRLESIPHDVPYITVPDKMKRKWCSRLKNVRGLKVGLSWGGNKGHGKDRYRSIPLSTFHPLTEIEGVQLVSLQKGEYAAQLKETGWKVLDWMDLCGDYLDTAALVDELDLVISVDTSVAHLAGALGKPVWLLNRFESEWRWMLDRGDSPWYPTMKIFRQKESGDWESVIRQVADELARLTRN